MKKKILFINPGPFASLTDTLYYCLLLKTKYSITYFGYDENKPTIKYDGINIVHLQGCGNSIIKKIQFIISASKYAKNGNFDFILINYFFGCSLINIFNIKNLVIDIRTSTISNNEIKKSIQNLILSLEVRFFKNSSAISKSLVNFLKLPSRTVIIPLGAPLQPIINKEYSEFNILYVGTFHQRNIEKTVYGFAEFIKKNNYNIKAKYSIIGRGSENEVSKINAAILNSNMSSYVKFIGEIKYPELLNYFSTHNVGMSFIPLEKQFDNQPPTKTFEYLLSGMIVLATSTKENCKVINTQNGVIIDDTIQGVSNGLNLIYENRHNYNSKIIQTNASKYSWETIISRDLVPYIDSFNSNHNYDNTRK